MEALIFTNTQYQAILDRLALIETALQKMSSFNFNSAIDNEEFIKLMGVSRKTAQTWRDTGRISYSQIGNKIYYTQNDIEQFLSVHHVVAFNQPQNPSVYVNQ